MVAPAVYDRFFGLGRVLARVGVVCWPGIVARRGMAGEALGYAGQTVERGARVCAAAGFAARAVVVILLFAVIAFVVILIVAVLLIVIAVIIVGFA